MSFFVLAYSRRNIYHLELLSSHKMSVLFSHNFFLLLLLLFTQNNLKSSLCVQMRCLIVSNEFASFICNNKFQIGFSFFACSNRLKLICVNVCSHSPKKTSPHIIVGSFFDLVPLSCHFYQTVLVLFYHPVCLCKCLNNYAF